MSRLFYPAIIFLVLAHHTFCSEVFTVRGRVLSEDKNNPVAGVRTEIYELNVKTFTDTGGVFIFKDVPSGNYLLKFSCEGYLNKTVPIIVDSITSKKDFIVLLHPFESVTDTINVQGEYFKKDPEVNTGNTYAVYEELRKVPGAVEDIIKYFQSSPGVSSGNDMDNDIICRGGSPTENLTLIDGIEIQNPNHYGPPGSTSGALSYINLKMIQEVDFYAGGFPVKYGDRLSSVMDIKFREGARDRHHRDLNLSVAGFGGFFEGPINSKSSYMFSIRRSYLELLKHQLNTPLLPDYWDINLKLNYDFSSKEKLSLVGVFAFDRARPYKPEDVKSNEKVDLKLLTYGLNYSKSGHNTDFKFILSHNYDDYDAIYDYFNLKIKQHRISVRTEFVYNSPRDFSIDMFYGNKFIGGNYDVYASRGISYTGYLLDDVRYKTDLLTYDIFGGFNFTYRLFKKRLTANAGIRFDYLDYMTYGLCISPRAGLSYKFSDITSLNLNIGYYYQPPEFIWMLAYPKNKKLFYIKSNQVVLGVEHFFRSDFRVNVETYYKFYNNYPVSVYDPFYMFISNTTGIYPEFLSESVSKGRGYFAGIDFSIQKKNSGPGFYGYLTYSYTKSKFYAMSGGPQVSDFDFGSQLTAIAGWKLKSSWAFSMRIRYYDGKPYTSFDSLLSVQSGRGIYDMSNYQNAKLPYYLRIDARIDKEFYLGSSKLILYAEVQNILNRTNIWGYNWSWKLGRIEPIKQWSILPVIGISIKY
jgi:hypothetical protein